MNDYTPVHDQKVTSSMTNGAFGSTRTAAFERVDMVVPLLEQPVATASTVVRCLKGSWRLRAHRPGKMACRPSCGHAAGALARCKRSSIGKRSSQ